MGMKCQLDRDLRTNLDDTVGWDLEVRGGVLGAGRKRDKETFLPAGQL